MRNVWDLNRHKGTHAVKLVPTAYLALIVFVLILLYTYTTTLTFNNDSLAGTGVVFD